MTKNVVRPVNQESKLVYVKCKKCSYKGMGNLKIVATFFTSRHVLTPNECPECGGKLYIDAKRIPPIIYH